MEYQTIFEAAPWGWRATAGIAIFVAYIAVGIVLAVALIRRKFTRMSGSVRIFCLVMTAFWLSIFVRTLVRSLYYVSEMQSAIKTNTLSTAEGVVEMVEQRPRGDTVRIEGKRFLWSEGLSMWAIGITWPTAVH